MTAFATIDDVATVLQRPLSTAEEDAATLLLDLASGEMEDALGVSFGGGVVATDIAGNWGAWLDLPSTPTSITSVAVNGIALAVGGWYWRAGRRLLRGPNPAEQWDLVDVCDGHVHQGAQQTPGFWHWGGDAATVHVVYVTPSSSVPTWLRSMCIGVVTQRIINPEQVKSESLGAYQVSYGSNADYATAAGLLTAQQVLRLQRRYRRSAGTIIPTVL